MICSITKRKYMKAGLLFTCALHLAAPQAFAVNNAKIPVPTKTIERGQIIASGDITLEEIQTKRLPKDVILDSTPLIGMEATRTLRPGKPIQESALRPPPAARSGEALTIAFTLQNLLVQATGRALEDGNKGDTIRVMNNTSKTIIDAEVMGNGLVVVRQ